MPVCPLPVCDRIPWTRTDPAPIIAHGTWTGEIVREPQGQSGFGYDPLFLIPDIGKTAAQLHQTRKSTQSPCQSPQPVCGAIQCLKSPLVCTSTFPGVSVSAPTVISIPHEQDGPIPEVDYTRVLISELRQEAVASQPLHSISLAVEHPSDFAQEHRHVDQGSRNPVLFQS